MKVAHRQVVWQVGSFSEVSADVERWNVNVPCFLSLISLRSFAVHL